MIKNLQALLVKCNLINNTQAFMFNTSSTRVLLARENKNESIDETSKDEDLNEFEKSNTARVKKLEQMGLVNKHTSWPKYNRIVYPPSEDGKSTKTPVSFKPTNLIYFYIYF